MMPTTAATVLHWNGEDTPTELRDLPKGRYVITPVDTVADLSPADQAGIEQAAASLAAGRGVAAEDARKAVRGRLER